MKISAITIFTFVFHINNMVIAQEKSYPAYSIPSESPISIREIKTIPPFLYFEGEIQIDVSFSFNYFDDSFKPYVKFIVSPTQKSIDKLPYLTERGIDEKPTEIIIIDKESAAMILLGDKLASEVFSGKHQTITGKAKIVIHKIGAGFECNNAVFVAYLKNVIEITSKVKEKVTKNKTTC